MRSRLKRYEPGLSERQLRICNVSIEAKKHAVFFANSLFLVENMPEAISALTGNTKLSDNGRSSFPIGNTL